MLVLRTFATCKRYSTFLWLSLELDFAVVLLLLLLAALFLLLFELVVVEATHHNKEHSPVRPSFVPRPCPLERGNKKQKKHTRLKTTEEFPEDPRKKRAFSQKIPEE